MSYVDEVIELVVKKNPAEPEFHQAVKRCWNLLELLWKRMKRNSERTRFRKTC